jgi:serine/threonine protein kinase
MHLMRVNYV